MNYAQFLLYTGVGASIWNLILMTLGYVAGENRELIARYSSHITITVIIGVLIIALGYAKWQKKKKKKK